MSSTLPTFREVFDAWLFYLTNEGNSASLTAKFTALATGLAVFGVCVLVLQLIRRRAEILDLIATAFLAAVMVGGFVVVSGWRWLARRCCR